MKSDAAPPRALVAIARALHSRSRSFAVVGGLAVSARCEPRFTRDVDIAVAVVDDPDAESLIHDLAPAGYRAVATVEHDVRQRLSTVRLMSPEQIIVDLLFASCGVEPEIVSRATEVELPGVGRIRVARAEDLLAMKILSMRATRLQDRMDAQRLVEFVSNLDLELVRRTLATITERGYHRNQDLEAKLASVLEDLKRA